MGEVDESNRESGDKNDHWRSGINREYGIECRWMNRKNPTQLHVCNKTGWILRNYVVGNDTRNRKWQEESWVRRNYEM